MSKRFLFVIVLFILYSKGSPSINGFEVLTHPSDKPVTIDNNFLNCTSSLFDNTILNYLRNNNTISLSQLPFLIKLNITFDIFQSEIESKCPEIIDSELYNLFLKHLVCPGIDTLTDADRKIIDCFLKDSSKHNGCNVSNALKYITWQMYKKFHNEMLLICDNCLEGLNDCIISDSINNDYCTKLEKIMDNQNSCSDEI